MRVLVVMKWSTIYRPRCSFFWLTLEPWAQKLASQTVRVKGLQGSIAPRLSWTSRP